MQLTWIKTQRNIRNIDVKRTCQGGSHQVYVENSLHSNTLLCKEFQALTLLRGIVAPTAQKPTHHPTACRKSTAYSSSSSSSSSSTSSVSKALPAVALDACLPDDESSTITVVLVLAAVLQDADVFQWWEMVTFSVFRSDMHDRWLLSSASSSSSFTFIRLRIQNLNKLALFEAFDEILNWHTHSDYWCIWLFVVSDCCCLYCQM